MHAQQKPGLDSTASTFECPFCHVGLTRSFGGITAHLRLKHKLSLEDTHKIQDQIFPNLRRKIDTIHRKTQQTP